MMFFFFFLVKNKINGLLVEEKHADIASLDWLQNQILTKGLSIILDEIQKHEGETLVDLLCVHECLSWNRPLTWSFSPPRRVWRETAFCFGPGVGQIFLWDSAYFTGYFISSAGESVCELGLPCLENMFQHLGEVGIGNIMCPVAHISHRLTWNEFHLLNFKSRFMRSCKGIIYNTVQKFGGCKILFKCFWKKTHEFCVCVCNLVTYASDLLAMKRVCSSVLL